MSYGLPDVDYTVDANGNPTPVASNSYVYNPVPFRYLTQYPGVQYNTTNLNALLQQGINDGVSDIVQGRRALGELDQVIAEWRSKGGDKIRAELQDALAVAA